MSTAKSNPAPGIAALHVLRDLLARWCAADDSDPRAGGSALPIVYRDTVVEELLEAFESTAVVASESMQHRSCAEVIGALAIMFPRHRPASRRRAGEEVARVISCLGDHVLTADFDRALAHLAQSLASTGSSDSAAAVRRAHGALRLSIGTLNSRGPHGFRAAHE